MKPSKYVTKIVMWLLLLGIAAYFVVYIAQSLYHSFETEPLYTYTAEEAVPISGYLFREEEPILSDEELVEVTAAEGERVSAGSELALVYDSEEAMTTHQSLVSKQSQLAVLAYIRSHSADDADSAQLNRRIDEAIVALRTELLRERFAGLSACTQELKDLVYRQDYTYNGNAALDNEITALRAEIADLSGRVGKNVSTINAPESGIFSSQVDGYESVMVEEALEGLTPSGLAALAAQAVDVQEGDYLGKLIYGSTWYYAATMSETTAARLTKGGTATLRFTTVGDLSCRVESISEAEDGVVVVVFSSDKYLSEVTLLRNQTVELVLGTVTGYRVDVSAVRMTENTSGQVGVYRLYGTQAAWVPVEILYKGEDYYLIRQAKVYDEDGKEVALTTLQEAKQLRPGAEIITKGRELYDGKVLR